MATVKAFINRLKPVKVHLYDGATVTATVKFYNKNKAIKFAKATNGIYVC